MTIKFYGHSIVVKNDNVEKALRKLKKKVSESNKLQEVRDREFYEKPTSVRKRKKSAAKARWRKQLRDQQLPKRLY